MAITSCTASHLARHHLSYGITSRMAITFGTASHLAWPLLLVRHHILHGIIFRTASPLAWPSPFVRHHVSHGSPLVWHHLSHGHHLSYGITSLIWHHISHGHRTASPLANTGITFAIVPTVAGWAGGELQFGWLLKKIISTTRLLLLVRLLPGFSTNLS